MIASFRRLFHVVNGSLQLTTSLQQRTILRSTGLPHHAQEYKKEEGKGSRFLCMLLPVLAQNIFDKPCQKAKLKLGKGKQASSNAVDTSFKARCKHCYHMRHGLLLN